jgi:adenosylcobinamide-GDP ribazoletransferase
MIILYQAARHTGFPHPFLLAVLCLAIITWLTGGLHIDGIGDVADAFGGGRTKDAVLQILKDTRMGAFGVCAIVFVILAKVSCWQFYFEKANMGMVFWSLVFSRAMQALLIVFIPNAKQESIAAPFGRAFARKWVIGSLVLTVLASALLSSPLIAMICVGSSLAVTALFGFYCWKRIGGITGDCVGAANEIAEVAVLVGGIIGGI